MPASRPFFQSEFGGIRLWISRITTDAGRDYVVQSFARGNQPDVQDRGDKPKIAKASLLFDDFTEETLSPMDRVLRLEELKQLGGPSVFTHPLYGSYLAVLSDFEHMIDEHGRITAEATFIADEAVRAVAAPGIGVGVGALAGIDAVTSASEELDTRLAEVGFTSDLPTVSKDMSASWFDEAANARAILVDIATFSDRVWAEVDELDLDKDILLWPLMRSYIQLADAMRIAADAANGGNKTTLMTVQVDGPMSLRGLISSIYPVEEFDERAAQAMSLNDIPTPGRIPTGTVLQLEQPTQQARARAA